MRNAKISLAVYNGVEGAPEDERLAKALGQMTDLVGQAADAGSDLVAFPEVANRLGSANLWSFEPLDGPTLQAMSEAARDHGIWVACPLPTIHDGGVRRNSSILIDRNGRIAGVYHKNFPTHGELDAGIIPGTETPAFETDFGRVGLAICFDLNYWEVGHGLCQSRSELVIWSSMWMGNRMLTKWALEFGFSMGSVYGGGGMFVDLIGRPLLCMTRAMFDGTGHAPLVTQTIDLDRRLLHHDYNLGSFRGVYKKYGRNSLFAEWINDECVLVVGSEVPGVSTDQLIAEYKLETMRDYQRRARRDRQLALEGKYPVKTQP